MNGKRDTHQRKEEYKTEKNEPVKEHEGGHLTSKGRGGHQNENEETSYRHNGTPMREWLGVILLPTLYAEGHLNSKEIHLKTNGDTFKY